MSASCRARRGLARVVASLLACWLAAGCTLPDIRFGVEAGVDALGASDAMDTAIGDDGAPDARADGGDGATCTGGETRCGGRCVDLRSDRANCGACGTTCPVACSGGACVTATRVGVGRAHACALMSDRTVRCWGTNEAGELGSPGAGPYSVRPVTVSTLDDVVDLSVGDGHACAVTQGGQVWCWGQNGVGQLGNGTTVDAVRPVPAQGIATATQVSAGSGHTCAVLAGGVVRCWGLNDHGQLGNGTTANTMTPVNVTALRGAVAQVASGGEHTCARTATDVVYCWGNNQFGQLGAGDTMPHGAPVAVVGLTGSLSRLVAGAYHTCVVSTAGALTCWGYNANGQLGDGTTTTRTQATGPALNDVSDVSATFGATCAVRAGNALWCTGVNVRGQLGDGSSTSRRTFLAVSDVEARAVGMGPRSTCVVTPSGGARCAGQGAWGGLGDGAPIHLPPTPVVAGTGSIAAIAAGAFHSCYLVAGQVRCVGQNDALEVGVTPAGGFHETPAVVPLPPVVGLAAGFRHTCAASPPSAVTCWGLNYDGASLPGGPPIFTAPAAVPMPSTAPWARLGLGFRHSCAVTSDPAGVVACWGRNLEGQLGDEDTGSNAARTVGLVGPAADVVAGTAHTCARLTSGAVHCWGSNEHGQLGDGTVASRARPGAVVGLSPVDHVASGSDHACAIERGTRAVQCWGRNQAGQLGDGSTTSRQRPAPVAGALTARALAAGAEHTCAVLPAGTVSCWGGNAFGQLGDGSTSRRASPVRVPGVDTAVALAAGARHTCARLMDGSAVCWGWIGFGQLGTGTRTYSTTFTTVRW